MHAWRIFLFVTTLAIGSLLSENSLAARAGRENVPIAPRQSLNFQIIDFLSDDNICGFTGNGRTKCVDWNMVEVRIPEPIQGFTKTSDVLANRLGICGYDVDGLKCIQEDRSKVKLRELMADSVRGQVVAEGQNACGVSAVNGNLRCLVPDWTSYSRHAFRIQPRVKITAVGVSQYSICWGDGDMIYCQLDGSTRSMKFPNADLIVTGPNVCARNATEAKCWASDGVEVLLSSEFQTAKKWFADGYSTMGAITSDNRFISLNFNTGAANPSGSLNVPPKFEQSGSPLTDVWADDYMHFCALAGAQSTATCWIGYSPTTSEVKFSEPAMGFIGGTTSAPCVLLKSGQVECADESQTRVRSLPAAGKTHARFYLEKTCVWNDKAIDCGGGLGPVESILLAETSNAFDNLCAVVVKPGAKMREVVCRSSSLLEEVPQATEGATALSVASRKACAISPVGVTCWGDAFSGEAQPSSFLDPIKVLVTDTFACGLDSFGLICWGDLATHNLKVPAGLDGAGAVSDFALGENRVCGVLTNGTVQCWGDKLADDEAPPATLTGVTAIFGSRQHVFCAANATGLHCWGGDTGFPR
ncbi:hypothetical protein BH10BDE1_BH10BDE1_11860 [soil metagenome]